MGTFSVAGCFHKWILGAGLRRKKWWAAALRRWRLTGCVSGIRCMWEIRSVVMRIWSGSGARRYRSILRPGLHRFIGSIGIALRRLFSRMWRLMQKAAPLRLHGLLQTVPVEWSRISGSQIHLPSMHPISETECRSADSVFFWSVTACPTFGGLLPPIR